MIGNAPPIIDTHAHLDDAAFDRDRDQVVADLRAAGVRHVLNIGYHPDSWETSRILRERYPEVNFALGIHPQQADIFSPDIDAALIDAVHRLQPLAMGETGFDFFRSRPDFVTQQHAFRRQIAIAAEENLPLIIHQRNAADELMEELDRWPELASIVLHSFDGNKRLTDWSIERGCYVGVGGLATRPASVGLRELLPRVPLERILLETDSPYLVPPRAATRRNTPANLPRIASLVAPLWNVPVGDFCRITTANAAALFDFDVKGDDDPNSVPEREPG